VGVRWLSRGRPAACRCRTDAANSIRPTSVASLLPRHSPGQGWHGRRTANVQLSGQAATVDQLPAAGAVSAPADGHTATGAAPLPRLRPAEARAGPQLDGAVSVRDLHWLRRRERPAGSIVEPATRTCSIRKARTAPTPADADPSGAERAGRFLALKAWSCARGPAARALCRGPMPSGERGERATAAAPEKSR
jgi:hypothetical protein